MRSAWPFPRLLWALYQFRLHQLHGIQHPLEARVNERTRIARDLHDTLLQSFHGLMFEFQAVRNMFHRRPEEAFEALDGAIMGTERAITESQEAIEGLRDARRRERPRAAIEGNGGGTTGSRSADHDAPTFGLTVEGERRTLVPTIRDEVYRIAREVLRNAFRHAHARRIEAEILYDEHQFRLRVRDDGKGMDPQVLEKGGRAGHWGLPGVRERAQQMGAKLDIWGEAGKGTEVQLTVAAAIAYERHPIAPDSDYSEGQEIMTTDLSLIRILTVDDHPLLRKGIAALVNAETDMKLVAEASNGEEAIEKFRSHRAGCNPNGSADAGLEWHRSDYSHPERIPERTDHRSDDIHRRCPSGASPQGRRTSVLVEETGAQRALGDHPSCPCGTKAHTFRDCGGAS